MISLPVRGQCSNPHTRRLSRHRRSHTHEHVVGSRHAFGRCRKQPLCRKAPTKLASALIKNGTHAFFVVRCTSWRLAHGDRCNIPQALRYRSGLQACPGTRCRPAPLNSHLADKLHRFAKEPSIVSSAQFVAQCVANWQGQAEMMNRTYAIQVRTPILRGKTSGSAY